MRNKNLLKIIIVFLIVLFFCILCFLIYFMKNLPNESNVATIVVEEPKSSNKVEKELDEKILEEKNDEVTLGEKSIMFSSNNYLSALRVRGMNTSIISSELGEGKELRNGYISYKDDSIQLRTTLIKTVRNIIFTNKYDEDEIVKGVTTKTKLKDIKELYPNNNFGGLDKDYLGYITNDFYYFFYDDEISVYGLTYREDNEFEKILTKYLDDRDLDSFVNSIKTTIRYYDYLEYDPEIKKAHIMVSNRGYEIDIEGNDPKGIILYNNYYFTDTTRDYVKRGLITLNQYDDLVEKIEKERRRDR